MSNKIVNLFEDFIDVDAIKSIAADEEEEAELRTWAVLALNRRKKYVRFLERIGVLRPGEIPSSPAVLRRDLMMANAKALQMSLVEPELRTAYELIEKLENDQVRLEILAARSAGLQHFGGLA